MISPPSNLCTYPVIFEISSLHLRSPDQMQVKDQFKCYFLNGSKITLPKRKSNSTTKSPKYHISHICWTDLSLLNNVLAGANVHWPSNMLFTSCVEMTFRNLALIKHQFLIRVSLQTAQANQGKCWHSLWDAHPHSTTTL